MSFNKRITVFAGHYGSGKTNIAVNAALLVAATGRRTAIADLDIVNPYFRTEDSREELENAGIRMICSGYANSNVDLPSMPEDLYVITEDKELNVIIDLGGDDRGALALGRLSAAIKEENNYEMLMVMNQKRPLTKTVEDTISVMREIEAAGRIPFTGLVNNTNLGIDTTEETVLRSMEYAEAVSKESGLPVVFTSVEDKLYESLSNKMNGLFPMRLQKRPV